MGLGRFSVGNRRLAFSLGLGLTLAAGTTIAADSQPVQPRDCSPATDDPLHGGLPFFDACQDAAELANPAATQAIQKAQAARVAGRSADEARLRGVVPTVRIEDSPLLGTPQIILSTEQFLTPIAADKAIDVVRGFLSTSPALVEIAPREIDIANVTRDAVSDDSGTHHFTFQQQIGGIDLFDAELRANVASDGRLINIGVRMLPRPEGDFAVQPARLTDLDAVRLAANSRGWCTRR